MTKILSIFSLVIWVLSSCSTIKKDLPTRVEANSSQSVDLFSLKVKNDTKEIDIRSVIVGEDYTYLSDLYSATKTKFYIGEKLFSGVGYVENESQITRITFKNGVIDGPWYDKIIWNGNLTNMGNYSNGLKDGEWKSYYDGKLYGTEIYINGVLKN